MGRPLNDKFFSNPDIAPGAKAGNQFQNVEAWIPGAGSGVTDAWIVRQNTNTTYTVTDGTDTGRCKLQAGAITGAGQMRIAVTPPGGGGPEYVKILNAHQVKTFSGNVYSWTDVNGATIDQA